jgi:excisionase family DNA binding protein
MATPSHDPFRGVRLVSLAGAAEVLAVSKRTLQRLIASGEFPAPVKVGAASRIRVEDLQRYIDRQQGGRR